MIETFLIQDVINIILYHLILGHDYGPKSKWVASKFTICLQTNDSIHNIVIHFLCFLNVTITSVNISVEIVCFGGH